MNITPKQRDWVAEAIYEQATAGYRRPGWASLRDCDRERWRRAADGALRRTIPIVRGTLVGNARTVVER